MTEDPVPHWPGRLVWLGDHRVYVRTAPGAGANPNAGADPNANPSADPSAGAAEPALCVHGLEGSSRNWTDLIDLLRPRLACDALDLPGFGDSPPRPDGRYSIAALAQTVTTLIERSGRGPVHLLGNSLGGAVCVKVAAARPDLIRTLTLISPALPDTRLRLDLLRFPLMSVPGVGARLLRQLKHLPAERRVADVIANCFSDPGRYPAARLAAEVAELTRRDDLDYPAAALVGSIRTLTAETLRGGGRPAWRDAARITAPTLVIYGADDPLVPARMAGKAARTFAGARIVVMPSTGHVAHMEHPRQVAAEINVLLDAASDRSQAGLAREFPLTPAG